MLFGLPNQVAKGIKCKVFVKELEWCANVLRDGTCRPMPSKLRAVEKLELPPTVTALHPFLGICNF